MIHIKLNFEKNFKFCENYKKQLIKYFYFKIFYKKIIFASP